MRVYVACSNLDSIDLQYRNLASNLATFLAKEGHKLLFNGGDSGMVSKLYMTYKYEEKPVKAIVDVHDTDNLKNLEVDAYEVVPSTFERSKTLFNSAELIIIMPGGIDTISEFLSMVLEKKQRCVDIPIILFDYNDYFTPLLKVLKKSHDEGFISARELKEFNVVTDLKSLEKYIKKMVKKEGK